MASRVSMADDDQLEEHFGRLRRAGTPIMGRNTYEATADYWPRSAELSWCTSPPAGDPAAGRPRW